ncbi:GumC family protein [Stenomitos frigidus]|nr:hypothetical protein [Stenomitos frigidus]
MRTTSMDINSFFPTVPEAESIIQALVAEPEPRVDHSPSIEDAWFPHLFNRRTGALAGAAIATVAGTSLIQLADQPATYEGKFQLLVEPAGTIEPAKQTPVQTAANQATLAAPGVDYDTQMQVLWSPKLLSPVVQQLQSQYVDLNYETLSQKLDIAHRDGEKTLEITYQDTDPKKVQAVLETVSKAYLQYSQECRTELCRELNFVERRLPQLQQQATVAKQNLQALQQQHGISEPTVLGQQLSQRLGVLTHQRQDLQIRLTEARTQAAILQKRAEQQQAGQAETRQPGQSATRQPATGLIEQALQQNDRYQDLLSQFQTIAHQLTIELARPQPDGATLQTLKQRYQQVSAQMTQAAQQPIAVQMAQAIADFQADKTTNYAEVMRQQTLLEGVTAATQVQVLAISQQAIVQTEGQIKQQIKQWAALARQYDELNLELKFATDNLNLYTTKRAALRQVVQARTHWQLTEAPAVEQASRGFTLADPEFRLSLGFLLSFFLVVFVMSIAEQTIPTKLLRRRRSFRQPEFSWQVDSWQADSWQADSWQADSWQTEAWQLQPAPVQSWQPFSASEPSASFSLLTVPVLERPLQQQKTTLFLLTAATRIETMQRAKVAA